ncbi:TIGR00366 family protein [Neptunomonas phycophila]|uniref:TIGR00366 family protein n=1 Tax=Neptunomonas phycophila TaxID=1572645 RepID=UPI00351392FD
MDTVAEQRSALQRMSQFFVTIIQRYLPDPFIFAAILTLVVFILVMPSTGQGKYGCEYKWVG